ncbi:hypothetical protein SERLA73DRAFT_182538 [Serpula lacrymans var. lacrymans S7.3]|uniref:Uncharacterized protein n=2 Tax=Serpula lacrymans var. lacrymans TaxID=341189 RepID=F8Q0G1_SERL3|nr:uncharacterized protein SERLADRAFT_469239 [Serpula lacrymans var. lacrymans S7.9]EGN97790.1 hypothetical protein SERLA73DRAFT_182538 [Serpula lacrymans var. lacrymans S7.3]EGO23382.1 hypothetical protein SERLADRAFT_469239 [Serpula lacrymans var. lacrymans S7.9]
MPNSQISLDGAILLSIILEAIIYGFSLLMFAGTIWALMRRRKGRPAYVTKVMFTIACAFLVLSTVHLVLDIMLLWKGLIRYRDTYPGGPSQFFTTAEPSSIATKAVLYTLQTMLGDGVVIYRCYIIWQSWRVVIVPTICWCAVAATGFAYVASSAIALRQRSVNYTSSIWVIAFYASSLTTNILSTSLAAYRIWAISRQTSELRSGSSNLWPIFRTILYAGFLCIATLLPALICEVSKSEGIYIVLNMIMPIISITFYMVIIHTTMTLPASLGGVQCTSPSSVVTIGRLSRNRRYPPTWHTRSPSPRVLDISRNNNETPVISDKANVICQI